MTPPVFDFDTEFKKLSKTCLSNEDHEQLWNNTVHYYFARSYNLFLIQAALERIGQTEMRTTLNFSPRRIWKSWGIRVTEESGRIRASFKPSESELASANTIESYYNLVEPRYVFPTAAMIPVEGNMTPAIAFLDTRFPFIRAYYRHSFEKILYRDGRKINRKLVDDMIDKFEEIVFKLSDTMDPMFGYSGEKSKNCDV
ncbi:unnamed protein product [Auanema sp. JU1783]|nr:unnamed protein product [Auanema sp. JU1783]